MNVSIYQSRKINKVFILCNHSITEHGWEYQYHHIFFISLITFNFIKLFIGTLQLPLPVSLSH